jgi:hypothetical protein
LLVTFRYVIWGPHVPTTVPTIMADLGAAPATLVQGIKQFKSKQIH